MGSDDLQVGDLRAEVARFCGGLDELTPETRLRTVAELRAALDEVVDGAMVAGMTAARGAGWGLRRIGDVVGLSHEKVRYRIAHAAGASREL